LALRLRLPNVYWTLPAPFATIVGLYTKVPDGGVVDDEQAAWLTEELRAAPLQAALIVALHHPIFSASWEHIGNITLVGHYAGPSLLPAPFARRLRAPDRIS
jgi:acid phosphatase type 7